MATLNLGRIKPVFRGAYNGATAYVVDDIVTSGGETFICILASTGNATSNATYWTKLAEKGTDGTDIGATLTTQGDVLYRDGSGLQRLAIGTAGQALKVNSGATAPEWGTVSSDYVKLNESGAVSGSNIGFDNYYSSTYKVYIAYFYGVYVGSSGGNIRGRFLDTSGNQLTGSNYTNSHINIGRATNGSTYNSEAGAHNSNSFFLQDTLYTDSSYWSNWRFTFVEPNVSHICDVEYKAVLHDGNNWTEPNSGGGHYRSAQATRGFQIFNANGYTMYARNIILYGLK